VTPPDVIVGWLQRDFGRLGRPGEAIARALSERPDLARSVAYVEPFAPAPGEPELDHRRDGRLHVFGGRGSAPVGAHEVGEAMLRVAGLERPVLLNFGVSEANWWLHYELAPLCATAVLVTHDKLALMDAPRDRQVRLEAIRRRLLTASDAVCGLSLGSIDDVPEGLYVGHGVDEVWHEAGIDGSPEPEDLAPIPHPRAVYVGALSVRVEHEAIRALARSGVQVVLIGFRPTPAVQLVIDQEPNVHFLGERTPEQAATYLLHCDVGIIPHTAEPFTASMEPHKAYNYAAAGLRTVTLNVEHAPALGSLIEATRTTDAFVAAVAAALEASRLGPDQIAGVRALTWAGVAERLVAAARGETVAAPEATAMRAPPVPAERAAAAEPALAQHAAAGVHDFASASPGYYGWERPELQALVPRDARRILDVGCGGGVFGSALKRRLDAHVTGIELVEEAAQVAERHLDEVWRLNLDAADALPTAPGSFDAIVCGDVLEHLRDPHRLLRLLRPYLAPDGRLVCSIPNLKHWSVVHPLLVEDRFTYEDRGLLDRTHVHFFTLHEIGEMMDTTGFHVQYLTSVNKPMPPELRPMLMAAVQLGAEEAETEGRLNAFQYLLTASAA
jgi:2-polyprenyl-3-methyl-5-hydroxy-6-metoxy-1,4-benzoquinol methylase